VSSGEESALGDFSKDLLMETLFYGKKSSDKKTPDSMFKRLLTTYFDLENDKAISTQTTKERLIVNFTNSPFDIGKDKLTKDNFDKYVKNESSFATANVVGSEFGNVFTKEVLVGEESPKGSDVAILKLDDSKQYTYPYLSLSKTTPKEGETIITFGFPGLVSGEDKRSIIDYAASSTQVSITRGIVSSIKKDADGHNLIQTDASIEHGNSGGPGLNLTGQVVGISTYKFGSDGGNYNFLRDIEDLKALAKKNNVVLPEAESQVIQKWQSALKNYNDRRYLKTLADLTQVIKWYPPHKQAGSLLESAKQEYKAGHDVDYIYGINKNLLIGVGSGMGLIILIALIIIIRNQQKKAVTPDLIEPIETNS
jgi:hypothetical protein